MGISALVMLMLRGERMVALRFTLLHTRVIQTWWSSCGHAPLTLRYATNGVKHLRRQRLASREARRRPTARISPFSRASCAQDMYSGVLEVTPNCTAWLLEMTPG